MKPSTFTISAFFQRERRYIVPLFQRSYVWERQWKPLWEDIKTISSQLVDGEKDNHHNMRNHFMGAVVLSKIDTFGHQVVPDEIIDGQQRLTTIQIFLIALRDFMQTTDDANQRNALLLKRLTENDLFDDDSERHKVWPTITDRKIFENITVVGSPQKLEEKYPLQRYYKSRYYRPRHKLIESYLYFYKMIRAYVLGIVETNGENQEEPEIPVGTPSQRIKALIDALSLNFEIVVIELEEKDDPQTIFETLNYLGEPLLPSDLIRNFVFLEAMRQGKPVEKLYNEYWSEYFNPENGANLFWSSLERQGRLNRPRFDLFIFHYLIQKTEREIPVTYLFQEFRDWWRSELRQVEDELGQIQAQSHIFKRFLSPGNNTRIDIFARRLRILDTSTVYPLLLYLFGEKMGTIPEDDLSRMVVDLESFLIRRMICGLTPKNYNRLFLSLLRSMKKETAVCSETLHNLLLAQEGESVRWPDDNEFQKAWLNRPIYEKIGGGRTRMILEAIDLYLHTYKQEQVHIDGEISVEHVMPQNMAAKGWEMVFPESVNEQQRLQLIQERNRIIHTFGNLTVITGSLNSENQDDPFSKKRPRLTRKSKLLLNTYFQDFQDDDAWLEPQIEKRGKELLKFALAIWPR